MTIFDLFNVNAGDALSEDGTAASANSAAPVVAHRPSAKLRRRIATPSAERSAMLPGLYAEPASDTQAISGDMPEAPAPQQLRTQCSTFKDGLPIACAQPGVTRRQVQRWVGDAAKPAQVLGQSLADLPLGSRMLVPSMWDVRPEKHGMTSRQWDNLRSNLGAMAARLGWILPRAERTAVELAADWKRELAAVPVSDRTGAFRAFASYCSAHGVDFADLTDQHVDAFGAWLAANTYSLRTNATQEQCRDTWSRLPEKRPSDDPGALWLIRGWKPIDQNTVHQVFKRVGQCLLGQHLHPHMARSTMATGLMLDRPGDTRRAADGLGHLGTRTMSEHYDASGTEGVSRLWPGLVRGAKKRGQEGEADGESQDREDWS
jgi:hypothetical protein